MFKNQNFCHVASNNRNNVKAGLFVYRTTDDLATVIASGYFNGAIIDVKLHDLIIHEKYDASDNTKVERNLLCVTEKTLENVVASVIKSKWEGDIEQAITDLETYVNNNFVNIDGSSTMTGPLKMRSSISFKCAIAPSWDGVGFYKLNENDSLTLMASMETTDGLCPAANNTYNLGKASYKWKDAHIARVITSILNNGYDIAVPVTNSADTLALKSQVDLAANSGSQLYDTGVWYAKMYAASTVPTGAEYDGTNYADFSQVDGDSNPIIVIYEGQSGAWVEIDRITPPTTYNGYITVTSKIWDIAEQTDQQGGQVLWSYNSKTFTPYPRIISVAGFADTDLSNLTDLGKNISNWSSNVTNCITEIPQDIKLELNNGTLTLKAGSKVYVPNGAGVFDTITLTGDKIVTQTTNDTRMYFYNGTYIEKFPITQCFSGYSAPSGYQYMFWYDATNNVVKKTSDSGSTWESGWSLPFCIATASGGALTSIDQIFNGFGYIGLTVFALPGLKVLIPDGKNTDGTLKNTEFATSNVLTVTSITGNDDECVVISSNGLGRRAKNNYTYNKEENKNKYIGVNDSATPICCYNRSSGYISNFNYKTVFHAVDYDEFENLLTEFDSHKLIAYQAPTSSNNYTWYRKYKDGWVEQGRRFNSGTATINYGNSGNLGAFTFPIPMADTNYFKTANGQGYCFLMEWDKTSTTSCTPVFGAYTTNRTLHNVYVYVCGMAAS